MAKTKEAKLGHTIRNKQKQNLGLKPKKSPRSQQKQKNPIKSKPKIKNPYSIEDEDPILFGSAAGAEGSESESESESESDCPSESSSPTRIQSVLEPCTKAQLVEFLLDAAPSDPQLRDRIRSLADADISHRRIFVAGFGSDVTDENLFEVFSSFGPIEDCYVVVDKATRRGKGYGFVLFKARSGAVKALKEPQKWIGSRLTTCQVASVGREKPDIRDRKIYVFNVPPEVRQERLREFFTKFGEIESGVMGFDGNSRAYAAFVYKTQEEAKKAMVEPHKKFDGHPLHCRMAVASIGEVQKVATPVSHVQTVAPAATAAVAALAGVPQQSVLAAVAPAQNIASLGQNPAYAALLPRNPLLTTAALNPSLVNAAALGRVAGVPYGGGAQSMLGGYSTRQVSGAIGLQGLQGYQAGSYSEGGQSSGKAGGDFGGYKASYLW